MQIVKRDKYLNKILQNISNKDEILFLIGPRQAGKTTLLKSLVYFGYFQQKQVAFLDGNDFLQYGIASLKDLLEYLKVNFDFNDLKLIIIDEAQLVPNLGDILFHFINEIRKGKYNFKLIVSGSGSLKIFYNLTDSLVGRKSIIKVFPFDFEEFVKINKINYIFSDSKIAVNEYLNLVFQYWLFGGYPKVVLTPDPKEKIVYLKEIYTSVLEKDIKYLLKEKEILNLSKVLKQIAGKIGSQITFSQIVEEAGIKRYEFEKIKFVLENTFMIKSLYPMVTGKFKKEIKKKEKIYFVDMGILRLTLGYDADNIDVFKGILVENFVFSQIFYNLEEYLESYFWANHNEVEIDFVIKNLVDNSLVCIDAKQKDKDNIPKGYLTFCQGMKDKIKEFIITSKYLTKERMEQCKFKWIPFVYINFVANSFKN